MTSQYWLGFPSKRIGYLFVLTSYINNICIKMLKFSKKMIENFTTSTFGLKLKEKQ
jgi:hypothetical protein